MFDRNIIVKKSQSFIRKIEYNIQNLLLIYTIFKYYVPHRELSVINNLFLGRLLFSLYVKKNNVFLEIDMESYQEWFRKERYRLSEKFLRKLHLSIREATSLHPVILLVAPTFRPQNPMHLSGTPFCLQHSITLLSSG